MSPREVRAHFGPELRRLQPDILQLYLRMAARAIGHLLEHFNPNFGPSDLRQAWGLLLESSAASARQRASLPLALAVQAGVYNELVGRLPTVLAMRENQYAVNSVRRMALISELPLHEEREAPELMFPVSVLPLLVLIDDNGRKYMFSPLSMTKVSFPLLQIYNTWVRAVLIFSRIPREDDLESLEHACYSVWSRDFTAYLARQSSEFQRIALIQDILAVTYYWLFGELSRILKMYKGRDLGDDDLELDAEERELFIRMLEMSDRMPKVLYASAVHLLQAFATKPMLALHDELYNLHDDEDPFLGLARQAHSFLYVDQLRRHPADIIRLHSGLFFLMEQQMQPLKFDSDGNGIKWRDIYLESLRSGLKRYGYFGKTDLESLMREVTDFREIDRLLRDMLYEEEADAEKVRRVWLKLLKQSGNTTPLPTQRGKFSGNGIVARLPLTAQQILMDKLNFSMAGGSLPAVEALESALLSEHFSKPISTRFAIPLLVAPDLWRQDARRANNLEEGQLGGALLYISSIQRPR